MQRIHPDKFKLPRYDDSDVIRAFTWFMSFIPEHVWKKRKKLIIETISFEFKSSPPFSEPLSKGTAFVVKDDQIGWYLYLVEMALFEPHNYEFAQGARVLPIFKRLGEDFELLLKIGRLESKVKALVKNRRSEADSILFEILTALAWVRNGWQVAFLEEEHAAKTPDFIAKKGEEEIYVECKRQSKTSDYTQRERFKWQNMISQISKLLLEYNLVLEIVFHVELESLPDDFLKNLIHHKIPFIVVNGEIVANDQVSINAFFADVDTINDHLSEYTVKYGSSKLTELIGGKPSFNLGFTCGIQGDFYRVGDDNVWNLFISSVANVYGVYWICNAKEAVEAKARDIKKQIATALEQFKPEHKAVIQIGIETFDGPKVENARFQKIDDTLEKIDLKDKNLHWIYCHFFQAYAPSHSNWTFDETVNSISSNPLKSPPPLTENFLIVPKSEGMDHLTHWERELP